LLLPLLARHRRVDVPLLLSPKHQSDLLHGTRSVNDSSKKALLPLNQANRKAKAPPKSVFCLDFRGGIPPWFCSPLVGEGGMSFFHFLLETFIHGFHVVGRFDGDLRAKVITAV